MPVGHENDRPGTADNGDNTQRESKHPLEYAIFVFVVATAVATCFAAYYTKGERDVMQNQEIRQLRAYITVSPGSIKSDNILADPVIFTLSPVIKVFGQTPARHIMSFGKPDYKILQYPLSPGFKLPEPEKKIGWPAGSAFPGADIFMEPFQATISQVDMLKIKGGAYHLYVYGELAFYDVFGFPRMTEWCFSYGYDRFSSGAAVLCLTHDDTRNDDYDPVDHPSARASLQEEETLNQEVFGTKPKPANPASLPPQILAP